MTKLSQETKFAFVGCRLLAALIKIQGAAMLIGRAAAFFSDFDPIFLPVFLWGQLPEPLFLLLCSFILWFGAPFYARLLSSRK